jgi:single-strand DNA-binding protein
MARGVNKVILVGTLGKDPEVRYSQAGSAMTSVSLATNEKWKDKNGEMQERTEWHRVKFFGRLAEIAGEYLKKGGQCYVEGRLRTEKYTDKQGVEKYSTDIIADEMMLLGGKGDGGGERSERGERSGGERPQRSAPPYGGGDSGRGGGSSAPNRVDDFPDDDIPF